MIEVAEILSQIKDVAADRLHLFDFVDWVDSNSWSMHRDSSPEAIRLVSSIDRLMAEYDHHDIFEPELRQGLLSLLTGGASTPHEARP